MDPWVTEQMVNMAFQLDQTKNTLLRKMYNKVMGTYLILKSNKPQVQCHTIQVRPFCPSDINSNSQ